MLPIDNPIAGDGIMDEGNPRSWWKWVTTAPQSYAVYLVLLVLVFILSFYAGTMKPQKATSIGPPPAMAPSAPRN